MLIFYKRFVLENFYKIIFYLAGFYIFLTGLFRRTIFYFSVSKFFFSKELVK